MRFGRVLLDRPGGARLSGRCLVRSSPARRCFGDRGRAYGKRPGRRTTRPDRDGKEELVLMSKQNKKVGFVSLGCPKNLVDSEVMMGRLAEAGYDITPNADEADTVVVNTCGFIESAKQESVDAILEAAAMKSGGNASRLIVAGCLVERYRDDLMKELPEVDAFIGTSQIDEIL